jgi:divalent metal cation (Fe/Co/Zn/Cd) transporter
MNDPELDLLIKEKMQKYVPARPVQIMHGGVIVLVSIAIGIFSLPSEQTPAGAAHQGLGIYLAIGGLILYVAWTYLRIDKAKKEAHAEFLATSQKNKK